MAQQSESFFFGSKSVNQNDQSQSSQSLESSYFESGQVSDGQESTRLTSGYAFDLADSSITAPPPLLMDGKLRPLDLVGENYEIISLLGVGGMGYVYRVRHRILQKLFAMKTLSSQQVTEIAWRRLQVEAQAIARMNHPNIVGIHNLGLHEERLPYYVMDLLDGEALADRLKREHTLSLAQALPLFIEVCSGLAYAHKKGIIHRDIKPGNIILLKQPDSAGATVKIVDFGIAKLSGVSDPNIQHLTSLGEVFGSPYYMSPEQCIGGRIDARSDIYSLGCTLFEALVGHPPFKGANPVRTMIMHQSQEPPTLSNASGKNFPDAIEQVVATLLAKAPMDRYQSLEKVAHDLRAIQAGRELEKAALFTTQTLEIESRNNLKQPNKLLRGLGATIVLSLLLFISLTVMLIQVRPNSANIKTAATPRGSNVLVPQSPRAIKTELNAVSSIGIETQPFSRIVKDQGGKEVKRFDFPADDFLGRIHFGGASGKRYGAQGTVIFPVDAELHLDTSPQLMARLEYFKRFRPDDFCAIWLFQQAMPEPAKREPSSEFSLPESYDSDIAKALFYMKHLSGLRRLDLSYCSNATDRQIAAIDQLAGLTELSVGHTRISGQGLAQLKCLKRLRALDYPDGTQLTTLLKALAGSSELRCLTIGDSHGSSLSSEDCKLIATCKNLAQLELAGMKLNSEGVAALTRLPHLKLVYTKVGKY